MAHYKINGKEVFIDNWLKKQIDDRVLNTLKRKDMDAVYVIDGKERSGKSVFAMGLAGYIAKKLGSKFDLSNICLDPLEFRNKIIKAKKNECVIYDEAHRGMGSSAALSEINKVLKDLMMEMGQKNLLVLVVLPTFFLLEKYVALFRADGLFHVYTNRKKRGFWVYFNERNKKYLYLHGKRELNYNCMKYPRLRGRFSDHYSVDETEYRKKKKESFNKGGDRKTRNEHLREDLKRVSYLIYGEFDQSIRKIEELYKQYGVKRRRAQIAQDILEFKD